jgi:hypothetical protein
MNGTFLVETPGGALLRKAEDDIAPDDMLVFDGPDAFRNLQDAQAELNAEIAAAGGIDVWRAANSPG